MKAQELTAMFVAARLVCSFSIEGDIHTLLDSLTLASTLWVVYQIRFKFKSTYIAKLDNLPLYYVVSLKSGRYIVFQCLYACLNLIKLMCMMYP